MKRGSKPLDMSSLRTMFADGKVWSGVGVVRARNGDGSHFKKLDDDVLVDVDLSPRGGHVWCRLGSMGGGEDIGIWRIPPVGTEVGVILPGGHPGAGPIIVATLSSGGTPDSLDGDVLLLVNSKKVRISSTDEDVEIQAGSGKKVKIGSGGHPLPKWDDFMTDLNAFVTSLVAMVNPNVSEVVTAATTLQTSIATATNYESQDAENS